MGLNLRNVVLVGLLAMALPFLGKAAGGVDRSASLTPESCSLAPTAQCVIRLSLTATGVIADPRSRAKVLTLIGEIQAQTGDLEEAGKTLSLALTAAASISAGVDHGQTLSKVAPKDNAFLAQAHVYSGIARSLVKMGKAKEARNALYRALAGAKAIQNGRYRTEGLVVVARAQIAAGALNDARKTIAEAKLVEHSVGYGEYLHGLPQSQAEGGDVQGALVTARNLADGVERAQAFADIAAVQAATGDMAGARATAARIEQPYFRTLAMKSIGNVLAKRGDFAGAWGATKDMEDIWQKDPAADARDKVILMSDLIATIVENRIAAGEIPQALVAAQLIEDSLAFVEAHSAIARAQTAIGDFESARATARTMCDTHHRYSGQCVQILAGLAVAQAAAGRDKPARALLLSALEIAERAAYPQVRAAALIDIYTAQLRFGDAGGAMRSFSSALAAASMTDPVPLRARTLADIGNAAAKAGDGNSAARAYSAALSAVTEVERIDERIRELTRIGLSRKRAGDQEGARRFFSLAVLGASAIATVDTRARMLAWIAFVLASGRIPEEDS